MQAHITRSMDVSEVSVRPCINTVALEHETDAEIPGYCGVTKTEELLTLYLVTRNQFWFDVQIFLGSVGLPKCRSLPSLLPCQLPGGARQTS